jgi:hypothetical protein
MLILIIFNATVAVVYIVKWKKKTKIVLGSNAI